MILEITRNNKKRLKNHKIHSILVVCWFLIVFVVFIVFERLKTATFGILIHPKYWNWPFGPKNKKNRSDPYWDLFFCWFGPKCGRSLIGPNQQKNRFHNFKSLWENSGHHNRHFDINNTRSRVYLISIYEISKSSVI